MQGPWKRSVQLSIIVWNGKDVKAMHGGESCALCMQSFTIHTCIPPTLVNLSMTLNGDGLTAATKVWPYMEAIANYKCANVYRVLVHDY